MVWTTFRLLTLITIILEITSEVPACDDSLQPCVTHPRAIQSVQDTDDLRIVDNSQTVRRQGLSRLVYPSACDTSNQQAFSATVDSVVSRRNCNPNIGS
jgi:hypothetical protein